MFRKRQAAASNSRSSTIVQLLDQSRNESISRRVLARLGLLDMLFLPPLLLPRAPPLLLPLQPLLGCSCWHVMVDRVVGAAEVQTMVWGVGVLAFFPCWFWEITDEPNQRHKIREEKNVQTHTHTHTHPPSCSDGLSYAARELGVAPRQTPVSGST